MFSLERPASAQTSHMDFESEKKFTWSSALLAFLIAVTFSGYPIYSFLSVALNLSEFDSRTITIPYRAVVLILSLGLFVDAYLRNRLVISSRTHKLYLIIWGLYGLRLIYETFYSGVVLGRPAFEFWAFAMGMTFLSIVGMQQVLSAKTSRLAVWLIWAMSLATCLLGLISQRTMLSMAEERLGGNQILNPISYGQTAVTLVLISLYLMLHTRRIGVLTFLLISTVPGFLTIAAAASRSPLISLGIGMLPLAIHGVKRGLAWKIIAGSAGLAVITAGGLGYLFATGSTLTSRLFETYDAYRGGELDRLVLWQAAWQEYSTNIFLGSGIELRAGVHPHNLIIESFLSMGLFGGALFLAMQFVAARNVFRLIGGMHSAWMPLLFVQFFILSLFSGSFYASMEIFTIMLLQAVVLAQERSPRAVAAKHRFRPSDAAAVVSKAPPR